MSVVLTLASLAIVCLPVAARRLGRRIVPAEWARLTSVALGLGAAGVEVGLLLLGAPTVLRAAGVPELASACERTTGSLALGGTTVGWVAIAMAVAVGLLALRGIARALQLRRLARAEPALGEHATRNGYELVILPTARLMAVTVPGRPPQVVVTQGLVSSVSAEQLEIVLRHEEVHLVERHDRYLLLAAAVDAGFGWLPWVRGSVHELRLALERWADDEAASTTNGGRAGVRDALIQVGRTMLTAPDLAAFSNGDLLVDRLEALSMAAPAPSVFGRALVYAPGLSLAVTSGAGLGLWIGQARMMLSMSGLCHI